LTLLAGRLDLATRVLVRRPGRVLAAPSLQEVRFDFECEAAYDELFSKPCDLLLIALGTTRAKAGSAAAFLRVDRDYPIGLLRALAATQPSARVGLVSSVGADRPRGLYLEAKAEVEEALLASGLACAIARPSLLRSDRAEFRAGEVALDRLFAPLLLGLGRTVFAGSRGWWRWAPVQVREVAETLLAATLALQPGERRILEGRALHPGPVTAWGRP
jgi:uncharacterized protein YbjT (DUF2867 family)